MSNGVVTTATATNTTDSTMLDAVLRPNRSGISVELIRSLLSSVMEHVMSSSCLTPQQPAEGRA